MPELLEELQRRVDHARARPVGAAAPLLDGLDDLVAVARSLSDRVEHEVANLSALGTRRRPAEPIPEPVGFASGELAAAVAAPRPTATARGTPGEISIA